MSQALRNDDIESKIAEPDDQPQIQLCDAHDLDLKTELETAGVFTEAAYLKSFHGLSTLAARTLGTDGVVRFKCPVCAFQQFPYITEMVGAAHATANRPRIILPS